MRIGYLILAHRAPDDLLTMLPALKRHGETYLHVDRDSRGFDGHWDDLAKSTVLPRRRHSVSWAVETAYTIRPRPTQAWPAAHIGQCSPEV